VSRPPAGWARPASVAVLVVLCAAPATALGSSRPAAGSPATTLAERYAPVVRLVNRPGPCGVGGAFQPTSVNAVLGNRQVAMRGPWDSTNIVKVAPTAKDLPGRLSGYNLDFPGNALSPGCSYVDWARQIAMTSPPTVYAHIATEPSYPGKLSLQYWFFYVFNDWNNKHEGDWEMVQLDFNAQNATQALSTKPYEVGYSQHESAERAQWGGGKLQIVDATHPVVYPSLGSNANYYSSHLYLGRNAAQGVGCDDTVGPSRQLRPDAVVIPESGYVSQFPWLGYAGRWGERHSSIYNGPTGPNEKSQWTAPITWADTAWRDESYAVPDGARLGHKTTDFFCSAIAAGSNVLTTIVGDPSPTLIALAALVVLMLWLASRTRWSPSAPFRIRRRRAWGSLVTTAFRMYVEHPRVFLEIGTLFIPVGLLTAGIQYLLFNIGSLAPLVQSAGATNAFVDTLVFSLSLFTTLLALTIVQAVTALAIVELDAGHSISALAAYRLALKRARPLLQALLTTIVIIALLDLTIVGAIIGLWLMVRWSLLAQTAVLDSGPSAGPLRRSASLTRRHWWKAATVVGLVAVPGLLAGPLIGAILLIITSASFAFVDVSAAVVNVVVLPFVAITTTYLYWDLQVQKLLKEPKPAQASTLPAEA
jgi:hypothetical protein